MCKSFYIFNKEALMEVSWLEDAQKKWFFLPL